MPALIAGASLAGCGSSGKKSVQLVLEAVGEAGAFPFTDHPDTDLRGVTAAARGGGARAGDARGAFGGIQGRTRCDKASLIKQLTDDPDKARAWAAVKDIDEGRIGEYINGLTETALEYDTLVRNHDFRDGEASEYLSVLQKGVLVLVDDYTSPAVKCNCGNPLLEPDSDVDVKAASYTGTRWETFTATEVTVIKARTKEQGPVKQIPLVDPFQGDKAFDRGVGSDGSKDSKVFHWDPPKTPQSSPGAAESSGSRGSQGPGRGGTSSGSSSDKSSSPPDDSSGPGSSGPGSSGPGSSAPGSSGSGDPSGGVSAQGVPPVTKPPAATGPSRSSKPKEPSSGSSHTTPPRTTTPHATAPATTKPAAPPTTHKPVVPPSTHEPVAPTATHKPVASTAERPVAPTAEKPVAPTAGRPVAPTEKPVAPTAAKPDPPPPPKTHAPPPPATHAPPPPTHEHPPATHEHPPAEPPRATGSP
ncbi:DUF6777 domain-containing protein [Streptomyces sp. NPDC008001]|uniref:DUF6777 domain-containing protein n=1 Tax=Streptomyces sp. NPDC008001 TaxID=3364804 RepID=UPI0036ED341B